MLTKIFGKLSLPNTFKKEPILSFYLGEVEYKKQRLIPIYLLAGQEHNLVV